MQITIPFQSGTPIVVEVSHIEANNKFPAISKNLQYIVNNTGISAMDILTKLSGSDKVKHSAAYFSNVTLEPDYNNLIETGTQFFVLEKDEILEFDDEESA